MRLVLSYFFACYLQPAIAGSLGTIVNVAAPVAPILERTDRIQQSLSIGSLVFFSVSLSFKFCCFN